MRVLGVFLMIVLLTVLGFGVGNAQPARIWIDAGHGGSNTGTWIGTGPDPGLYFLYGFEKDINLDVVLEIFWGWAGNLNNAVYSYTRVNDRFVFNETRPANANAWAADIFISVHHNARPDRGDGTRDPVFNQIEGYYNNWNPASGGPNNNTRKAIVGARIARNIGLEMRSQWIPTTFTAPAFRDPPFLSDVTVLQDLSPNVSGTLSEGFYLSSTWGINVLANTIPFDYRVIESDAIGYTLQGEVLIVGVNDPPEIPQNFRVDNANNNGENPILRWSSAANAQYYEIFRSLNEGWGWEKILETTNTAITDYSVIIDGLLPREGVEHFYKARAVNSSYTSDFSNVSSTWVLIQEKRGSGIPTEYKLDSNYPNPFNPVTRINYQLPKSTHVTLVVYNIKGQEVARLVNTSQSAGHYSVTWDASSLASGVYVYRITAGSFSDAKRMILIK